MGNLSISTKDNNNVSIEISEVKRSESSQRRILQRVPPQLRENKNHIFDPVVLSLGPYHHNRSPNSKFLPVEEFKKEVLNITLEPATREIFYSMILEQVDEIRIFYGGVSIDEYKDEELAEMVLCNTCFVLYYMGMATEILEDTIWLLPRLDTRESLLYKFLSLVQFADDRLTRVPWEDKDQEPLHLLEALRRTLIEGEISKTIEVPHQGNFGFTSRWRKSCQVKPHDIINCPFRSARVLETKGIHLGRVLNA